MYVDESAKISPEEPGTGYQGGTSSFLNPFRTYRPGYAPFPYT